MKKLIALLLVLALMLGVTGALGEMKTSTTTYGDGTYGVSSWDNEAGYSEWKHYAADGTLIEYSESTYDPDTDTSDYKLYSDDGKLKYEATVATGNETGTRYNEDGSIDRIEVYMANEGVVNSVYFDTDGNIVSGYIDSIHYDQETGKWLNADGTEAETPDVSAYWELAKQRLPQAAAKPKKPEAIWYTNNTAGVIGISLRDEYPELTKKWYNVLPVDLSQDGTQTFQLVASNLYYIGSVSVTVAGDEVTTTYSFPTRYDRHIYPEDECLAWFTGVDQITGEFLENPTANAQFGTAISKEKDLNGQSSALLFVCNHVTYRMPLNDSGDKLVRFWRNHYKMADYFNNAKTMLEKVEAEHAEKKD